MMSIGISVFVIIIAALNLFLDFDRIERHRTKDAKIYGFGNGTNDNSCMAIH
jgi:uncharacterized YccA/Bax inhibitor family protein